MTPTPLTVLPAVPDSPIACSLPSAEMGGRLGEFDHLFAAHLRSVRRGPEWLELTLGGAGLDIAEVTGLIEREHACCPFFEFELRRSSDRLVVEMRAPEGAGSVLESFAFIAEKALQPVAR